MSKLHWSKSEEEQLIELYQIHGGNFKEISEHLMLNLKSVSFPFYSMFTSDECKQHWDEINQPLRQFQEERPEKKLTLDDIVSSNEFHQQASDFSKNPKFSALYDETYRPVETKPLDPTLEVYHNNVTKSIFGYDITPSNFNILYDDLREGYEDTFNLHVIKDLKFPNVDDLPEESSGKIGPIEEAEYLLEFRYKYLDSGVYVQAKPIVYLTEEEKSQDIMTTFDDKDPYVIYMLTFASATSESKVQTLKEQLKDRKSNIINRSL